MPITTKTGDKGMTGLFTGERVAKFSAIMEANGTIDELDSFLGEAKHQLPEDMAGIIEKLQVKLYDLMAEVASRGKLDKVKGEDIKWLEDLIGKYESEVTLEGFVIPGSTPASAKLDVCRAVARRAERMVSRLVLEHGFGHSALVYLNRLSDLLFLMARYVELREGKIRYAR
ncbi:cob(I)yrinic acid a,c-diamide adenosyltransferase [Thermococcus sp.]|uniref:cob(I)yrinic acid a,c-diamide adenosyltransferase n=1 Tax=Thermococcus sp. TaxID=35749 RepID=UPI00260AA984|nr:cob(I)yrinic acid a,c-diamide adenosyltransferase [Thermococcus sp.]